MGLGAKERIATPIAVSDIHIQLQNHHQLQGNALTKSPGMHTALHTALRTQLETTPTTPTTPTHSTVYIRTVVATQTSHSQHLRAVGQMFSVEMEYEGAARTTASL